MQGPIDAEFYFILGMMVLILIISGLAVFFFFRQYKREMSAKRTGAKGRAALDTTGGADVDEFEEVPD